MKVKKFKGFSLKMLRCEARAFPVGTATSFYFYFYFSHENFIILQNNRMPKLFEGIAIKKGENF